MIYNILWSSKTFGGGEIYVRQMKKKFDFNFISLENITIIEFLKLIIKLLNFKNTFIFHDTKASCFSIIRFFLFKDYCVLHGPGKNQQRTKKLFKFFSFYTKKIILVSSHIFVDLPSKKFIVLENKSTFDSKCNYNSYDFIYFGRIEESKGVDKLCNCWSKLVNPPVLHIIGDGKILNELKKTYKNSNIIFYGALSHNKIPNIIEKCGFYTSFSPREGTSLSLYEAMSTGLIPLVVDIPTQHHIKKDIGLEIINHDYSNAINIINNYFMINSKEKEILHNKVNNYINNDINNEFDNFWKNIN